MAVHASIHSQARAFNRVEVLRRIVFPVVFGVCATQPCSPPTPPLALMTHRFCYRFVQQWVTDRMAVPVVDERLSMFLARRQRLIRCSAGKKRVPHLGDSLTNQIREEMNIYRELHILLHSESNLLKV